MNKNLFSDIDNKFITFKLNEKGFTLEQIEELFALDEYFCNNGIGKQGAFIRYLLDNEAISYNVYLIRNAEVVLKYQEDPVFNRIAERLRCTTIPEYFKCVLSVRKLEDFCDAYTSSLCNHKCLDYKRDENGYVILEPKDYLITNIPFKGSREGRWYLLSNRTRVFIKNHLSLREGYSELVAEEIAKQMGIPHAEYDLVNMGGLIKTASINMLDTGEELRHGSNILKVLAVKDISIICDTITNTLKNEYPEMDPKEIQAIKEDFLKITIFDKIIGNWDRNPDNWGFIIPPNNGKIRLAPEFDNNRALDQKHFDYSRDMHINGDTSLDTLLEYCFANFSNQNEFLSFVSTCVQQIDVDKAHENIYNKKGISIPQNEIIDMHFIVHGRGTQKMRHWLEEKQYKKRVKDTPDDFEK